MTSDALFDEIEQYLFTRSKEWLDPVVERVQHKDNWRRELCQWLAVVDGLYSEATGGRTKSNQIGSALAGWLACPRHSGADPSGTLATAASRRDLVDALAQLAADSQVPDDLAASAAVASGFGVLLLSYLPGPRLFRGVPLGRSNLLPEAVLRKITESVRVPFGAGSVSWMTRACVDSSGEENSVVVSLEDAGEDLRGRVAAQDYASGHRSVIGFPIFPTLRNWGDMEQLEGFFFLTHILPGVFPTSQYPNGTGMETRDLSDPLVRFAKRVRMKFMSDLSALCRSYIFNHFAEHFQGQYEVTDRPGWVEIAAPKNDPAGLQAILGRDPGGTYIFSLNEQSLVERLSLRLRQVCFAADWKNNCADASDLLVQECESPDPEPWLHPSFVRIGRAERFRIQRDIARIIHLLKSPDDDSWKAYDLVLPVSNGSSIRSLLRLNLAISGGEKGLERTAAEELRRSLVESDGSAEHGGATAAPWKGLSDALSSIFDQLDAVALSGDRVTLKRAIDAWGAVAEWVVARIVDGLEEAYQRAAGTDFKDRQDSRSKADFDAIEIFLGRLLGDGASVFTSRVSKHTEEVRNAIASCPSSPPECALVSFWSRHWLPHVEQGAGDELDRHLLADPAYIEVLAYEAAKGDQRSAKQGHHPDHGERLAPHLSWSQPNEQDAYFHPLVVNFVPGRVSRRAFAHVERRDVTATERILAAALVGTSDAHWQRRDLPAPQLGAAARTGAGQRSGRFNYLCFPDENRSDPPCNQAANSAGQSLLNPYLTLAVTQIASRIVERYQVAQVSGTRSVEETLRAYAHEMAQVSDFLETTWATKDPTVHQAAFSYLTIWAPPKYGDKPALFQASREVCTAPGGARRYIELVFGVAKTAGSIAFLRGHLGRDSHTDTVRLRRAWLDSVQLNHEAIDPMAAVNQGLFHEVEGEHYRPADVLSQALCAAIVNALKHLNIFFRHREHQRVLRPLLVRWTLKELTLLNPCYSNTRPSDGREGRLKFDGTNRALQYFLARLNYSSELEARLESSRYLYPSAVGAALDDYEPGVKAWKSRWKWYETRIVFPDNAPISGTEAGG